VALSLSLFSIIVVNKLPSSDDSGWR